jgi:predicted Zn-dependent protease
MNGHRLILPLALLLIGGGILVSVSAVEYRVDFTSLVELWADVFRDADRVGLTATRVSDRKEMELGAELSEPLQRIVVADPKLQRYVSEVGQRLVKQARRN